MELAERLKMIPPYAFAEIEEREIEALKNGQDIICMGVGDPNDSPSAHMIEKMTDYVKISETNRYPDYDGLLEFREAVGKWCEDRFGYVLDKKAEIQVLIGAKEGITNLLLAYVNAGDYVLITDPAYPIFKAGTYFAGGIPYALPLLEENNFLPDLSKINKEIAKKAKLIIVNYPNNPTGAAASLEFFKELVGFCRAYDIILCNDAAYTEITFDGYVAPSILQVKGAKDIAVEIHTFSKSFNMAGWRIGFAVGNRDIINGIRKAKVNIDSGQFHPIQLAAKECLMNSKEFTVSLSNDYCRKRNILTEGLEQIGLRVIHSMATCFLWVAVPKQETSQSFANQLFDLCGISCAPGSSFGYYGEGYVRFSLTVSEEKVIEAVMRMTKNRVRLIN